MGSGESTMSQETWDKLLEEQEPSAEVYAELVCGGESPDASFFKRVLEERPLHLRALVERTHEGLKERPVNEGAVRLVCSLFPVLYCYQESSSFVENALWSQASESPLCPKCGALVNAKWVVCPFCELRLKKEAQGAAQGELLGEQVLDALLQLLFVPGWTVESEEETLWSPLRPAAMIAHRVLAIKALLAVTSQPLFAQPATYRLGEYNAFARALASRERQHSRNAFLSMALSMCLYEPNGIGLPYNHVFTDMQEGLLYCCFQLSLVLLAVQGPGDNVFRTYVRQVPEDFLVQGLTRILTNPLQARSSRLPGSTMLLSCQKEALILLYVCLQESPAVLAHIVEDAGRVDCLLRPLLYCLSEGLDDPKYQGQISITAFILLKLSAERLFALALNSNGNADALVATMERVIKEGTENLHTLHVCLATILCNVSPYLKSLNMSSAVSLINVTRIFGMRASLLEEPSRHKCLYLVITAVQQILQLQYSGNLPLAYALINAREMLLNLWSFRNREDLKLVHYKASPVKVLHKILRRGDALPEPPVEEVVEPEEEQAFQEWRTRIPLEGLMAFLEHVVPILEKEEDLDQERVIKVLSDISLVGVLPLNPIEVRRGTRNAETDAWLGVFVYGIVYVRNPSLFTALKPTLFQA